MYLSHAEYQWWANHKSNQSAKSQIIRQKYLNLCAKSQIIFPKIKSFSSKSNQIIEITNHIFRCTLELKVQCSSTETCQSFLAMQISVTIN